MSRVRSVARVLHTLRYLRARQLFYQVRARLPRRVSTKATAHIGADRNLSLSRVIERPESYLGGGRFRFLNQTADLGQEIDWVAPDLPLLWRYNLHYFDYLQQPSLTRETGNGLIEQWIGGNPPADGRSVGWEPYPTSLRIVNWIKFISRSGESLPRLRESLAVQAENLAGRIEYHLLGNHLFANAKALWFAGVFLQQNDWAAAGRRIALEQLCEQFLPDGGHFELSPMYHAIAVEDLLDLINLARAASDHDAEGQLCDVAGKALGWLGGMVHANGALPLLNDSADGIAPRSPDLVAYAQRLSVSPLDATTRREFDHGWTGRNYSGYWTLTNGVFRLLFDTAALGPDYLPGHAHCDMLSVLLDVRDQSVLTDTGVFEYAESRRRAYSRSTAAHNTVQIDDLEQGDIWKSFRMGKRGRPVRPRVDASEISCEHTGFSIWRRGLTHRRTVHFQQQGFEITDDLSGADSHRFASRFHFAPGTDISVSTENNVRIGGNLLFTIDGGAAAVVQSEYYPQFGLVEKRPCLVIAGDFRRSHQIRLTCTCSS